MLFNGVSVSNVPVKLNLQIKSVVATTNKNSNASLVYAFLYKLVEVSRLGSLLVVVH